MNSNFFQIRVIRARGGVKKITLIVGLKVSKKAVIRNKVKRRMKEIVRLNLSKIRPGCHIFIVARPLAANQNYRSLEKDLISGLIKIGR